jgi:tRNA(fMet)-specific endonuclease VapC
MRHGNPLIDAMRYLIDTNILLYAYKNLGLCRVKLEAQAALDICICPLNIFEISVGINKSQRPQALQLFLDDLQARHTQVHFDNAAANQAALLRATLERQGQPIGPYDVLLAGTALAHGLIVVTRNVREFQRVPGLQIENWYD